MAKNKKNNNQKAKGNNGNNTFPVDENDDDVMVTIEVDGGDIDCEILTIFTLNTQDYIVLMPVDEHDNPIDDTMVYIYRYYEDKNGTPSIDNIQTDEEYNRVNHYFRQLADRDLKN